MIGDDKASACGFNYQHLEQKKTAFETSPKAVRSSPALAKLS
jgi:hypothetical protein